MTYVLTKSEVGICKSIFRNLTIEYANCLESITDWSNAANEPIYCCTKADALYEHFEYCCLYGDLLSQHRIWLFILLLFVIATGAIFAFTFLLNLYMIVVAVGKADIPNINKLAFLPKPNFFPPKDKKKKKKGPSERTSTRSRSSTKSKRKSKRSGKRNSKELAEKKTKSGKTRKQASKVDSKQVRSRVATATTTSSHADSPQFSPPSSNTGDIDYKQVAQSVTASSNGSR